MTKSITASLTDLGLSEYEAKAYVALIRKNPATAYEIGKSSGVPTSKIYEVLKKLIEKDTVSISEKGRIRKYIPIEPDEFLDKRRLRLDAAITSVKRLAHMKGESESSAVWSITDYDYLTEKAQRMIDGAVATVLISTWKEEMERIESSVREATKRDVQAAIVHFGNTRLRLGQMYHHPIEDTIYYEKNGRGLIVVADSKEVLMGAVYKYGRVEGAWSRNRGFATLAEDYIKHDIYIMKIIRRYDRHLKERFGSRYEKLRDIFKDEDAASNQVKINNYQ
jgi:sugar-specific transcriptional regulator TrmB